RRSSDHSGTPDGPRTGQDLPSRLHRELEVACPCQNRHPQDLSPKGAKRIAPHQCKSHVTPRQRARLSSVQHQRGDVNEKARNLVISLEIHTDIDDAEERGAMNKLALIALAAGAILTTSGTTSAQYVQPYWNYRGSPVCPKNYDFYRGAC